MEVLSDMFLSDETTFGSPNAGRDDHVLSNTFRSESHRPRDSFNVHKSNKSLGKSLEKPNGFAHKAKEFSTNGFVDTKAHQDRNPRSTPITTSEDDPLNNNSSLDRTESLSDHHGFPLSSLPPEQEDLLEALDHNLTRTTNNSSLALSETETKHSDESSFPEDGISLPHSFSSNSTDLQVVDRDNTFAHTPHAQERTYSSSISGSSAYENSDDAYDCISSDSSDLDFVRSDATHFWVLFGIRKTYSSPSGSEKSYAEGNIETLPSEETDQDAENLSHSPTSDSSDLEFVRRDDTAFRVSHAVRRTYSSASSSDDSFADGDVATLATSEEADQEAETLSHSPTSDSSDLEFARRNDTFFRVPHVVGRTYSSASSFEDSFADGEIATLATREGDLSSHRSCSGTDELDQLRMDKKSDESDAQPLETYTPKYGDEGLGSWSSSDFDTTRDCERWAQMSRVVGRTYSSSEESLKMVNANVMASHHEVANQNSPHKQLLMGQPKYTDIQPQESQVMGSLAAGLDCVADKTYDVVQRNTSVSMEYQTGHDPSGREQAATKSVFNTEKEHCSACEKLGEAPAPHSRKANLVKRAGRMLGMCFGRASESSQACNQHHTKGRRSILRAFFKCGGSKQSV